MPRERTFWLLLATLLVAGWGASFLENRAPRSVRLTLTPGAPAPVPQPPRPPQEIVGRAFRPAAFEPLATLGIGGELTLPTLLRVDGAGNAYVLDSGRERILKLGPEGRPLATYGPGDLGNPSDFVVDRAGEVWVTDPDARRITVFDPRGEVARRIVPERPVFRLSLDMAGDRGFIATSFLIPRETLFDRYSETWERRASFGRVFPTEYQNSVIADGWLVDAGEGGFVYLFRHAGLLASYTRDGRPRFFRRTVVPLPLPEMRIDIAGNASYPPGSPLASISGSIVGPELWVLAGDAGPEARVLDVYAAATGTYRYSVKPPEGDARYVVVTADRLWSASRRGVRVWRRAG